MLVVNPKVRSNELPLSPWRLVHSETMLKPAEVLLLPESLALSAAEVPAAVSTVSLPNTPQVSRRQISSL